MGEQQEPAPENQTPRSSESKIIIVGVVVLAVVGLLLVVTQSGGGSGGSDAPPGDPEVYARIEQMTSCSALQDEFDTAMTNAEAREPGDPLRDVSLSYADAAQERIEAMSC